MTYIAVLIRNYSRMDDIVVLFLNVQEGRALWGAQPDLVSVNTVCEKIPFVAIRRVEVRIEVLHVKWNLTHSVCTVYQDKRATERMSLVLDTRKKEYWFLAI